MLKVLLAVRISCRWAWLVAPGAVIIPCHCQNERGEFVFSFPPRVFQMNRPTWGSPLVAIMVCFHVHIMQSLCLTVSTQRHTCTYCTCKVVLHFMCPIIAKLLFSACLFGWLNFFLVEEKIRHQARQAFMCAEVHTIEERSVLWGDWYCARDRLSSIVPCKS